MPLGTFKGVTSKNEPVTIVHNRDEWGTTIDVKGPQQSTSFKMGKLRLHNERSTVTQLDVEPGQVKVGVVNHVPYAGQSVHENVAVKTVPGGTQLTIQQGNSWLKSRRKKLTIHIPTEGAAKPGQ